MVGATGGTAGATTTGGVASTTGSVGTTISAGGNGGNSFLAFGGAGGGGAAGPNGAGKNGGLVSTLVEYGGGGGGNGGGANGQNGPTSGSTGGNGGNNSGGTGGGIGGTNAAGGAGTSGGGGGGGGGSTGAPSYNGANGGVGIDFDATHGSGGGGGGGDGGTASGGNGALYGGGGAGGGITGGTAGTSGTGAAGIIVLTYTIAGHAQINNLNAFGDSITAGSLASTTPNRYVNLLSVDKGLALTNHGISGEMACDMADTEVFSGTNPSSSTKSAYTIMIGLNDADVKGNGAYEVNYNNCLQAVISWLGVPKSYKTLAQGCVSTGTWSNDAAWASGVARVSTENAATLTCTLTTTGGPIYAWYRLHDGDGGTFTYSLDGGATTSVSIAPVTNISTQNGGTHGNGLIRITGAAAGIHNVVFTVTSATDVANIVSIGGIGTPARSNDGDAAYVYVGGVTYQFQNAAGILTNPQTTEYNDNANTNAALMARDGLRITFAPVRNFITGLFVQMGDQVHPNDLGHSLIRNAFESVWQL